MFQPLQPQHQLKHGKIIFRKKKEKKKAEKLKDPKLEKHTDSGYWMVL